MSQPLPAPRQVPGSPGRATANCQPRIWPGSARANRTEFRSFASLLGRLPGALPSNPSHLASTIATLNHTAFTRLLAYTGHDPDRLIQAIPSLALATFVSPDEPPALRVASLRDPSRAVHPECTALAVLFASPYWAELAVPSPDRRHRLFYRHLLIVLDASGAGGRVPSIRNFDPLPQEIREQASWGRLLSDPDWGSPIESREGPRKIPFIDIMDAYERSVA